METAVMLPDWVGKAIEAANQFSPNMQKCFEHVALAHGATMGGNNNRATIEAMMALNLAGRERDWQAAALGTLAFILARTPGYTAEAYQILQFAKEQSSRALATSRISLAYAQLAYQAGDTEKAQLMADDAITEGNLAQMCYELEGKMAADDAEKFLELLITQ